MPAETPTAAQATATEETLRKIVRALDEKKAGDLRVLRVSAQSSITDYLVLATGTSEPHLRALRVELEKVLDADRMRIAGMDSSEGSGWTVVDAYQVMIHLFTPDKRDAYRLEQLWNDAEDIPVPVLLGTVPPAKAEKAKPVKGAKSAKSTTKGVATKPKAKAKPKAGAKPKASAKAKKAPAGKPVKKVATKAAPAKKAAKKKAAPKKK